MVWFNLYMHELEILTIQKALHVSLHQTNLLYSHFIQLEFYATRELRVGDSQIISAESDYAIDGQYVSNWPWIDLPNECSSWDNASTNTSFIFLDPNVTIIKGDRLPFIQNMNVFFTPIIGFALSYLLHKLLPQKSNIRSQSFSFFIGFLLSTITLGFVLILAEVLSWIDNRPKDLDIINIKYSTIFATTALFVVFELIYLILCDERINPFKHTEIKSRALYTILLFSAPTFFFYFALLWIIASSFDTLLFAVAYPVYVITLVVLHIAFVLVESIFFAFIVSEVIRVYLKRVTASVTSFECCKICLFLSLLYLSQFFAFLYLVVVYGYSSTIVQRVVPAGVVQGLLFVPSLILFAVGWLLKRRLFATGIYCIKCMHIEAWVAFLVLV